jgi:hypothetical protein
MLPPRRRLSPVEIHEWVGRAIKETPAAAFYKTVRVETETGKFRISVGDAVHLHSDETKPYIGEVEELYEEKDSQQKKIRTRWFFRPSDIAQELLGACS